MNPSTRNRIRKRVGSAFGLAAICLAAFVFSHSRQADVEALNENARSSETRSVAVNGESNVSRGFKEEKPSTVSDFVEAESHASARPRFSSRVSAEDREALELLWTGKRYREGAMLAASFSREDDRHAVLLPLMREWTRSDPKSAAAFALSLPTRVERSDSLETVVREWASFDIATAGEWLASSRGEADFDGAYQAVAVSPRLLDRFPEVAMGWAENIEAPALRSETICAVMLAWTRRDENAAVSRLERSSVLPQQEKANMLTYVRRQIAPVE